MRIVQLLASPFVGGPERQLLGLARGLPRGYETTFLTFAERGLAQAMVTEAHRQGFESLALRGNAPWLWSAAREIAEHLRRVEADVLCCNGYKADIIGCAAARLAGIPAVAIAHGWTAATLKVRVNEALDRQVLRWMDAIVCVSAAQVLPLLRLGLDRQRIRVIHNAIDTNDRDVPDPAHGEELRGMFGFAPRVLGAAIGRLSPEKGFDVLVDAVARCRNVSPKFAFVIFGHGPCREALERQIEAHRLGGTLHLAGFRGDVAKFLPHVDLVAIPSYREGLPVSLLEACAAALPVVASAVGGIPEVIRDEVDGYLVPAGDVSELARRLEELVRSASLRRSMGEQARQRVRANFSVEAQCARYQQLFDELQEQGMPRKDTVEVPA